MPRCIVANCSSKQNKITAMRGVILHVFPPNIDRIKTWLRHIGQDFGDLDEFAQRVFHSKKNGSFRICSDHFTPQSYVEYASKKLLRVDAVPTIFNREVASRPSANKRLLTASGNGYSAPSTSNIPCDSSNTFPSCRDVPSTKDPSPKTREASTQSLQRMSTQPPPKTMKSECNDLSNIVTDPNKINEIRKKLTERILQLTLEIICLLIGEECTVVVKKNSGDYVIPSTNSNKPGGWSKSQGPAMESLPPTLTPEKSYNKILEVNNKISQLLKGEVPIWCQDVTVSFSMDDQKNVGPKNMNKGVSLENQPLLSTMDGSRNTPERCPQPLYTRDHTQEHYKMPSYEGQNLVVIKVEMEDEEDESNVICGEPCREEVISTDVGKVPEDARTTKQDTNTEGQDGCVRIKEEEVPIEIGTDPRDAQRNIEVTKEEEEIEVTVKVEEEEEEEEEEDVEEEEVIQVMIKEEETPMEIGTDGTYTCSFQLPNQTGEDTTDMSSDEYLAATISDPVFLGAPVSPEIPGQGSFADHSYPIPQRADSGQEELDPYPYTCPLCKKCFADKSILRQHERTHKKEMPFTCLECGKTFMHNSRFISHRRIHTGERPFSCSKCGKCFVNKPDLVRHDRTHTGEKPFSCPDCGKRFTQRVHLVTHHKKHGLQKLAPSWPSRVLGR